jgi:uroporphyrinogen decarboxylase
MGRGASAYQLFDSWAGGLTAREYADYAHPYHETIFRETGGVSILFVKDLPFVEKAARSGATALSLGTNHDLAQLKKSYPHIVFQGNVDHMLLVHGTVDEVRQATARCVEQGGGRRHVLNLDHGMDPNAHVENFETFVATAKEV